MYEVFVLDFKQEKLFDKTKTGGNVVTKTEQKKLREIIKQIDWFIKDRRRALDIHTAPYKKYEKGGSKEGEDITNDPNWIKDKGWIEGTTDALMAWETAKRMIVNAFPEIFSDRKEEV